MTFGELLGAMLGWLGEFIEWMIDWVPRYEIVQIDEIGVRRYLGKQATELRPGVHWFVPNLTDIDKHHTSRMRIALEGLSLETKDNIQCQIGMVVTYHITDVLAYDVENYEADDSIEELVEAALRDAVMEHDWSELRKPTEDGRMLESKLSRRVQKAVERYGVTVETVRPRDQIRLRGAYRLFGNDNSVNLTAG